VSDPNPQWEGPIPPPPRPVEYRDVDASGWWVSVLLGVVLVLVGVWLLTNLFESVVVLAWIVGVSFIVGGVAEVLAHRGQRGEWLAWVGGGLLAVAGITALVWPAITLWALAVIAGLGLILAGCVQVIVGLVDRDRSSFWVQVGLGGFGVLVGVVVLAWPEATLVVLALMLGLRAVVSGVIGIATGWELHRLSA
jgi:uncharacterized membrane protein HdeD (DUF308 family)